VHPVLFQVGPLEIRSYGVFMAAGFAAGAWWLVRRGRARGLPAHRMLDLVMAMIVTGLIGGRLLYVLTHWGEFAARPLYALLPIRPGGGVGYSGLVYYGGIGLAIPVAAALVRRWELSPWKVLDAGAPALALGTAVGRLGCFFNGCCYGHPTDSLLGMVFPPGSLAGSAFPGVPIHPTQLYMVAYNLAIAGALLLVDRRWGRFDGTVIGAYLILTGFFRALVDLFRYYEAPMRAFEAAGAVITVNQLIGLGVVAVGTLIIARSRTSTPEA